MRRSILFFLLFLLASPSAPAEEAKTDPSQRMNRLELQLELYKNAQEQRLDERLKTQESMVKGHHDTVVRESGRLHDRADMQLSWLMWGLAVLGILAAIGAIATAFLIYPKVKQAKEDQEKCANLREEIETIKNEIIALKSQASDDAIAITQHRKSLLSNEAPKEEIKRLNDYMETKEAQAGLFSQAMIHTKEERWDKALVIWQDYLKYDKNNPDALFNVALSASRLAETQTDESKSEYLRDKANIWYNLCNNIEPYTPELLCNWGNMLSQRGQNSTGGKRKEFWQQAKEKYSIAVKVDPYLAVAWHNWGALLVLHGRDAKGEEQKNIWDQAEKKFNRATEVSPQYANAWSNWGNLLVERGKTATEKEQ